MNILLVPYNYYPNHAGGETYLHYLAKGLQTLGHQIRCLVYCEKEYDYDGITCYPLRGMETIFIENNNHFEWADIVFGQLLGNAYAYNKAKQHNKKSVFIAHNTSKHYFTDPNTFVIYNSHTLAALNLYPDNKSVVLQPLVPLGKPSNGRKIALVNCNDNKGGHQLIELAKMLPQYEFVGIKGGYGEQIKGESQNLTYRENQCKVYWNDIGLLLVPSETESWSQAATEAINHNIPVICSDLPGLRENLSYAGLYIQRLNLPLYAETIVKVMSEPKSDLLLKRANELNPLPRLLEFNEWLINL